MYIRVCSEQRQWRVLHPHRSDSVAFHEGRVAYDFADALARELHESTGLACSIRVEAEGAHVVAARYG